MASTFEKLNLKDQGTIVVLNAPESFEPELKALKGDVYKRQVVACTAVASTRVVRTAPSNFPIGCPHSASAHRPSDRRESRTRERTRPAVCGYTTALCAITWRYHSALSLGVRFSVLKST